MIVTEELMNKGLSSRGGWSERQLKALGVPTTKRNKGWKSRLIGSDVASEKAALFLMLKDKHLKKDADQAKMFIDDEQSQDSFAGGNKYNCGTCVHHKLGNCNDLSDDKTCVYWFSPDSKVKGIAYGKAV